MKNFKLAFWESHILMRFLISAFIILYMGFCTLLTKSEPIMEINDVMTVYSFNAAAATYCFFTNLLFNMKFYKTLPLKSGDITSVNALNIFIGAAVLLLGTSVVFVPFGKAFLIPYHAVAMFIYAAFSLAVMPLVFKANKYSTDAVNAANEKQLGRRTVIIILCGISLPLIVGIPGTAICVRGWKAGTFLMSDLPMLLTVCAVCAAVSVIATLIYKKKIPYYIY